MKFLDEYRDPTASAALLETLRREATKPWTIMEICGGQTHSFLQHGLDAMLPAPIELVHGPGCPVCVTPLEQIDRAVAIASRPEVIFTSFGDMLRVPGSERDLFGVRARGGDVRVVYSPLDALAIAEAHPKKEVVFFAIGFETTAPANAMAVLQAHERGVKNFSMLVSQVRVPPAIAAILSSPSNRVQAFLAAGHVCTVMGYREYEPLAEEFRAPIVVTGFEPVDLLRGLLAAVRQLAQGRHEVENAYPRLVSRGGNRPAQEAIARAFTECDRAWRGIGVIPRSGWRLRDELAAFNAEQRFDVGRIAPKESALCIAGDVLRGIRKPPECPAFGKQCTPQTPLGAPMVSAEGACAAYYRYRLTPSLLLSRDNPEEEVGG
ncbi:MAG: hydrogenase formation protein HypD [Anaerolineales bacterium]|nr:hydrogenase formation protein HypD [Anaerolineales bacterium]